MYTLDILHIDDGFSDIDRECNSILTDYGNNMFM